nr:uncharacterized protein LOC115255127 [Aedes albopictus]
MMMGAKCSTFNKKDKKSPESKVPNPQKPIEQYYSADIQHLLPNVQYSRPLYRFSNGNHAAPVDLNARILDVRDVEDDLRMESMLLRQNRNIPLGRSSTPDPPYCYHCDHQHRERCCLHRDDKLDDVNRYSTWTEDFRKTPGRPQDVKCIPEAVSYNSSPHWFPRYTSTNPNRAEGLAPRGPQSSAATANIPPSTSTVHYSDKQNPELSEQTPYQQYASELRQMEDMDLMSLIMYNRDNPYLTKENLIRMLTVGLQYRMQNIYNGPVYMQQNNISAYSNLNPYMDPPQYGMDASSHHGLQSYLPPNPAAQVHSGGFSLPIWVKLGNHQNKIEQSTLSEQPEKPSPNRKRCARKLYQFNEESEHKQKQQVKQVDQSSIVRVGEGGQ